MSTAELVEALREAAMAVTTVSGFKYEPRAGCVMGRTLRGDVTKVCDIRSWGYHNGRGHGALGMETEDAQEAVNAIGRLIALAASPDNILRLLDALQAQSDRDERVRLAALEEAAEVADEHSAQCKALELSASKVGQQWIVDIANARDVAAEEIAAIIRSLSTEKPNTSTKDNGGEAGL